MSEGSSNPVRPDRTRHLRFCVLALFGIGALAGLAVFVTVPEVSTTSTDSGLTAKELLAAARAATQDGREQEALRLLDQVPDDGSSEAVAARTTAGGLLLTRFKRLAAAEQRFRRAVAQDQDNLYANDSLAWLMHMGTRSWELVPFELSVIRQGQPTLGRMKALAMSPNLNTNADFINACSQVDPQDPTVLLGLATTAIFERQYEKAEDFLRVASAIHPHPPIVDFRLGEVLLLRNAGTAEFLEWHRTLPPEAIDSPGIWLIQGQWFERQNQPRVSVRCFWEALRRDPNLALANYRLGQLLVFLKHPQTAEPFLERSRRLTDYLNIIEMLGARVMEKSKRVEIGLKAAELTESLGLIFEACGWFRLSLQLDPTDPNARQGLGRLQSRVALLERVRTIPEANPALKIDLSEYSLPDWSSIIHNPAERESPDTVTGQVTFEDHAADAGLEFSYINDTDDPGIYALNGGGVAVLDYDGDGWPDLYLTQGGDWPARNDRKRPLDRLFRNLGNGRFQDVTRAAGLIEDSYSQGVAAGDYNNDGFPDLCVANLNANRLYCNNGDGTFSDVTIPTGTGGQRWTSSCAIADLNGDTWPDIYFVNYLGETALSTVCRNQTGRVHDCNPRQFPAEQDRLLLNLGDGRFEDITLDAGIVARDGKGLGIVVADFDGSGNLEVYVANDGVPNFLFVNQSSAGQRPRFVEQALPTGVAVNGMGNAEGGMGVAAGDVNGNGRIDLFVTNFSDESNTLYLNQPGNGFLDATNSAGLAELSLPKLGFGTQCLDGELDGRLDLVVTNGHIDPDTEPRLDYEMEPQYFGNRGEARFVEVPGDSLGSFFVRKHLGRGMARVDWNRDGLEDIVISHLNSPTALLTNTTAVRGHELSISLRGVACERDAIGTVVTLTAGDSTLTRQLTAGDGYQASNERILVFGLGDATRATEVQIDWPSGRQQNVDELQADNRYTIIEGRQHPIRMSN